MEPLAIVSAYLLDLALGDPRWLPHPVRGIGKLITFLEKGLRTGQKKYILRLQGILLTIIVVGGCTFGAWAILNSLKRINSVLEIIIWIFLAYTSLAIKDLFIHAKKVLEKVEDNDIEEARRKLSFIVGRDTKRLSRKEIIAATIESIAENANDGIIAPLFYLILGGPTLAIAYKAVNTLDSMVGYRNERYIDFGWFPAKLDDVVNFVPARIAGFLIVISSFILSKDFGSSFRTMFRDGRKHSSPNSGVPEAAMAGALGIRLGGLSIYGGRVCARPFIGESKNCLQPQAVDEALRIAFVSSFLIIAGGLVLKWVI